MKKRSRPLLTAGISSLLLIFVSLCLLTFAVLSLVSARADWRLSSKIADRTAAYYQASNQAHDRLAEIDAELALLYENTSEQEAYFSGLESALSGLKNASSDLENVLSGSDGVLFNLENALSGSDLPELSFSVPINEDQILAVSLEVQYPTDLEDSFYIIRQWKTVNISDWTPDTRQNLYIKPES